MLTRKEILSYGLSFPNTYQEAPFHDPNWQLVRVKGSKKAFLWTYEREDHLNLNVKVDPGWRDFWRNTYDAVIPAYHQNKEHWNTIILDGSIPDEDVKRMIAESYDLVTDSPTKRIYEAVKMGRSLRLQGTRRWQERWEMPCITTRIRSMYPAFGWSMQRENCPENLHSAVPVPRKGFLKRTVWRLPAAGWI